MFVQGILYDRWMVSTKKVIGTLLPITSLVSKKVESGTFAAARQFLDWLEETKQSAWQLLPLNQTQLEPGSSTKHVSSPYKGYGIGLDPRFLGIERQTITAQEFEQFMASHGYWVHDYALFCALRDHFETDCWTEWSKEIAKREQAALSKWHSRLGKEVEYYVREQAELHVNYANLRAAAKSKNILIIGDLPFYIGMNSPLVWKYAHLFQLQSDYSLKAVSGVLQGKKSHYGRQVWGHPLYNWQERGKHPELLQLFKLRLRHLASLFDWIRFDHAKGLFTYGAMSISNEKQDKYLEGPGKKFLTELIDYARSLKLEIYAEDTGDSLVKLRECLRAKQIPGVKIFRFAYNEKRQRFSKQYLDFAQYPIHTFAYTTTHDTEPLLPYLEKLSSGERQELCNKLEIDPSSELREMVKSVRDKLIDSPARFVIIPLQDWVYSYARINTPGTETEHDDPNWQYKMESPIEDLPKVR